MPLIKIYTLVFIAGFTGGSVYPLIKLAEEYDIPKFSYIFWESLFVVILLSLYNLIKKQGAVFQKENINYNVFCALTNILIPQSLFFWIAPHLPTNIISIIIVLTPLLVYAVTVVLKHDYFVRAKLYGLILALIGVSLLFLPKSEETANAVQWFWILAAFLIPADYTLNRIIATKLRPNDASSTSLAIGLFSFVCLASGLLMIVLDTFYIPVEINVGNLALFFHAVLMSVFYIIFFDLAKLSALHNSLSFYIAPLVGFSWGIFLFQESLTTIFMTSTLLIFLGLYLVNQK